MTETQRARPWWQVTPGELAWRFGCDAEQIEASVSDPDELEDWQLDLLTDAVGYAKSAQARWTIPDRDDPP